MGERGSLVGFGGLKDISRNIDLGLHKVIGSSHELLNEMQMLPHGFASDSMLNWLPRERPARAMRNIASFSGKSVQLLPRLRGLIAWSA